MVKPALSSLVISVGLVILRSIYGSQKIEQKVSNYDLADAIRGTGSRVSQL